jgi:hypothetical protein
MPFKPAFDPVYDAVRQTVAAALPDDAIDCYWMKDVHAAGSITDDMVDGLKGADVFVADVTGHNPNVMWETGYAMALGKPVILIGQDVESLPFDLRVHRVVPYRADDLPGLAGPLTKSIQHTVARYGIQPDLPAARQSELASRSIAVTGSCRADPARVRHRLSTFLEPYLAHDVLWYTGSSGNVDEAAAEYLVGHKQRVIAIGYTRFDVTSRARELVQSGQVRFLDASLETVPRSAVGPTPRDILFSRKADLVILLWDGQSKGTETLVRFYEEQGTNLLLAFV